MMRCMLVADFSSARHSWSVADWLINVIPAFSLGRTVKDAKRPVRREPKLPQFGFEFWSDRKQRAEVRVLRLLIIVFEIFLVAVLEVSSSDAVEEGGCGEQHGRGSTLLGGLPGDAPVGEEGIVCAMVEVDVVEHDR